jgi:hypothetical protein
MRRVNKIRERLDGDSRMPASFPPKPKGMWWRTYKRSREQALAAEMRADAVFVFKGERFLAQKENAKRKRTRWR